MASFPNTVWQGEGIEIIIRIKKKILKLTTIKASPRTDNKSLFEDGCLAVTLNCQIFQLPRQ